MIYDQLPEWISSFGSHLVHMNQSSVPLFSQPPNFIINGSLHFGQKKPLSVDLFFVIGIKLPQKSHIIYKRIDDASLLYALLLFQIVIHSDLS